MGPPLTSPGGSHRSRTAPIGPDPPWPAQSASAERRLSPASPTSSSALSSRSGPSSRSVTSSMMVRSHSSSRPALAPIRLGAALVTCQARRYSRRWASMSAQAAAIACRSASQAPVAAG